MRDVMNPGDLSLKSLIWKKADSSACPKNYRDAFYQYQNFTGPDPVTPESIEAFRDALLEGKINNRRYAPSSVALKVKAIKSLIRQVVADNPQVDQGQAYRIERELGKIKCPTVPVGASRIKTLSRQQIYKLLHECKDSRVLPLMKTILLNGCRLNEALQLTWRGLEPSGDGIFVHRGIIAKGGKEIHLRVTEAILENLRRLDLSERGSLFPWKRKAATIRVKRAIERTLGVKASAHTLRHSFATLALEEGLPLSEVSEWLNHASPKTTAQYYLHGKRSEAGTRFSRGLVE